MRFPSLPKAIRSLSQPALIALGVALIACGGDGGMSTPTARPTGTPTFAPAPTQFEGGESNVDVALAEWSVTPDRGSVAAGVINFRVANQGSERRHQLAVIRTELAPDALPVTEGRVDENAPGVALVDKIDPLEPAKGETLTLELPAGKYVLICNVSEEEDGESVSHYQNGMRAALTVQ